MKRRSLSLAALLAAGLLLTGSPALAEVKMGDNAPDFKLPGSDGKTYTLSELTKNQVVVVAWYPKSFTGG